MTYVYRLGNVSTNRAGRDSPERRATFPGGRQKRVSPRRLVPLPSCHCIVRAWRHGVEPVGVSSPGYAEPEEVAPGLPFSSECAHLRAGG